MSILYPETNDIEANMNKSVLVQFDVSAPQIIAEGVPVTISHVIGTMGSVLSEQVSALAVCFTGAFYHEAISKNQVRLIGSPFAGSLVLKTKQPMPGLPIQFDGPGLVGEIVTLEWRVEGDYATALVFYFHNGTAPVTRIFEKARVHVESAFTIHEEERSRNLQALEIGTFAIAIFEGFNWFSRQDSASSSQSRTQQEEHAPRYDTHKTIGSQESSDSNHERKR